MDILSSLPLFVLVAANCINLFIAYIVARSDAKNASNQLFAFVGILLSLWLALIYMISSPAFSLLGTELTRLSLFLIAPIDVLLFMFAYTFPDAVTKLSRKWFLLLLAGMALAMFFSISPYAFIGTLLAGQNAIAVLIVDIPFAFFSVSLNLAAVYFLMKKMEMATGEERSQFRLALASVVSLFALIIIAMLLPFLVLQYIAFVSFAALFAMIFLGITAYALIKHHLFNVRVSVVEAFTTILVAALLAKAAIDQGFTEQATDVLIAGAILLLGALFIRSIHREIKERQELEVLSRFKSELLSLAAHQIRSPLAALKGFATLIIDDQYGPVDPKAKEALGKMKNSADELISLVNTLLDMRKVEEGKMEYKFAKTDLGKLIDDAIALLFPLAKNKGLALTFTNATQPVFVNADGEKLKQVIQNLVDNAIKYTPSGWVHVALSEEAGMASVAVSDSGLGISAALIPYLFEEFIRDERVKKDIRGTGLGLYIARKITEAHQGTISVESPGEGKGSTFHVSLPVA